MKVKNFVIYATAITIVASGVQMELFHQEGTKEEQYIEKSCEQIVDDDYNITAHRGFSSLEVENTKESFSLAADKNYVDYIEMDARMTKDQKIVLSHDDLLLSKSREREKISTSDYDDVVNNTYVYNKLPLRKIFGSGEDTGLVMNRFFYLHDKNFKVVGLPEGINNCGDKKIIIDLKFNGDIVSFVNELKRELVGVDTSNIIFQSLDLEGISYLQSHSDYECLALIKKVDDLDKVDSFRNVGFKYTIVTPELIDECLKRGKKVAIWTINNTDVLDEVVALAGDNYKEIIYISDYPDLIVTRLLEYEKRKAYIRRPI